MMDRAERKYIVSMLGEVANAIKYEDKAIAATNLGTCIEALIYIRSLFENHFSVNRFIQYDEIISTLLETLNVLKNNGIKSDEREEIYKLLVELVSHVKNLLINEKEIKREIVFLPYKASMWDSLDTIWRAAVADKEHCNAYVVPIPYADRNPDGSARTWHHEIDLFPADVPVLDYRKVDLKKLHPDVIFIHNPYDERNYVTSVEANYYSYRIKQYTDKLVYVPYFVSGEAISKGMCEASAMQYVDHVIVESEKIKEMYEKYYPYGEVPKDKFLALGSPIYDKVKNAKKEDYPLPKDWHQLVMGKKIILYATTIGDHLQHSGYVIEKLESILGFFKNRNDVILWWRPHPLLQSTFDAMCQSLSAPYREIVEQYKKDGWGIYDDTPDMDRAIVWSDAYYGDASSLVWLYRETGKPIVLVDYKVPLGKSNDLPITSYNLDIHQDKIYFVPRDFAAIVSYDIKTKKAFLTELSDAVDIGMYHEVGGVIKTGERLVAYPMNEFEKNFFEISLINGKQKSIDCKRILGDFYKSRFLERAKYKGKVFIIGVKFCVLVYTEKNNEYYCLDLPDLSADFLEAKYYVSHQFNGHFYVIGAYTEKMVDIDLEQESIKEFSISNNGNGYRAFDINEQYIVCVGTSGNVFVQDKEKNINFFTQVPEQCFREGTEPVFVGIYGSKVCIFFQTWIDLYKSIYEYVSFDLQEKKFSEANTMDDIDYFTYLRKYKGNKLLMFGRYQGKNVFYVARVDDVLHKDKIEVIIDVDEQDKIREAIWQRMLHNIRKYQPKDEKYMPVEKLCKKLTDCVCTKKVETEVLAGTRIYEYCCGYGVLI